MHDFELVGGDPALDLVNTIHDWTVAEPRDYLPTFGEALRFGLAAGVLTRAEAQRLRGVAAGAELRRLRVLRTRLERIFRAWVGGRPPARDDLDGLAGETAEAAGARRLRLVRGRFVLEIDAVRAGAAVVRWRIAEAAIGLLTSARAGRVKACPGCGWFFVDETKNRSRRWCSMSMCGSSAKSRSYYWRTRARRAAQ
ncbi:MAG TPA: CGNR zinc finger domain-containing protein [Longimicrobiales bacterium]|nr:CGNR zinc finger domain-containing protein [Longimicrobiales bacterium]